MRRLFILLICLFVNCKNKTELPESFSSLNVFDSTDGYWETYSGKLYCKNCDGIKTTLQLFISPFIGKMKYKLYQSAVPLKTKSNYYEGSYESFGRLVKRRYQTVYQINVSEAKKLFFIYTENGLLTELTTDKKEFTGKKKFFLEKK